MGLLVLHSGHYSKIFRRLIGTTCTLRWRNEAERELVWTVAPGHPIAAGVPHPIVIEEQEMYGEPFDIPAPDELVFISSFTGGEVFRSGCCYTAALGRIFYFSPGDQEYPSTTTRTSGACSPTRCGGPRRGRERHGAREPGLAPGLVRVTPLRVGVIGVGWAGQQHLAAYERSPGSRSSPSPGWSSTSARSSRRATAVSHAVDGWEDLLDLDDLDAVSVAVPTFLHAPIALAALERGPARARGEADRPHGRRGGHDGAMRHARPAACSTSSSTTAAAATSSAQGVIDEGRLGRPYYAKAWWMRRSGIPTLGSWFTRAELAGGGPLMDIGVHVLDYALFLLGNPAVTAVSAVTYDLLGSAGFGSEPARTRPAATARPSSTSRTSPRSSCAWRAGARCRSRRAGPPIVPTTTSSASRCTAPAAAPS